MTRKSRIKRSVSAAPHDGESRKDDVGMTTPRTARPLRERQREEREQLILEAAQELLVEKGYHEMSMDEIAARVGIAKGTVYLHFPSKEELMFALITRDMNNFLTTIDQHLAEADTPTTQL